VPLHILLTIDFKIRAMKIYVFIQITILSQFFTEDDRAMKEKRGLARVSFAVSIRVMDEFFGELSSINHR